MWNRQFVIQSVCQCLSHSVCWADKRVAASPSALVLKKKFIQSRTLIDSDTFIQILQPLCIVDFMLLKRCHTKAHKLSLYCGSMWGQWAQWTQWGGDILGIQMSMEHCTPTLSIMFEIVNGIRFAVLFLSSDKACSIQKTMFWLSWAVQGYFD